MRWVFVILIVFATVSNVAAQYYSSGEDPGTIRWKEIDCPDFQIIFPEDYVDKAQQLAYVLEKVYEYGYKTLDHPPRKISVIIHSRTVTSNGMVAWAPKRMELFVTPAQDIYAQDWLKQLAVHEFRHVVQMDKIQSDLPAILPVLFGEQATAAVVGLYLPFWFLEGDAVMTETALTFSGRGRQPSFLMKSKAQVLEKGLFSYDKAVLGSYKDYVPNRYMLGYWLAGGIRRTYGAEVWTDVLSEIGRKPFSVTPLNKALKNKTGMQKESLYALLFKNYSGQWKAEVDSLNKTTQKILTGKNNTYTNYLYINAISDSSVVACRDSRDDIRRIVRVSPSSEKTITTPGNVIDESFSATGDRLIWSESRHDLRWTLANHTAVVVYDMVTGKRQVFFPENNLAGPTISPDYKAFAAVETDNSGNYSLSVFDLKTGERVFRYRTPDNQYFFSPTWDSSSRQIYFIALSEKGKYIGSLDLSNGSFRRLTDPAFHDIRSPAFYNGKIYYISSITGIDNVFSLDLSSLKRTQVSSVPFGADCPSVFGNQLFFGNYSADGYAIAMMKLSDSLNKPADDIVPKKYELAESLAAQEKGRPDLTVDSTRIFPVKPYRKMAHLFNFHSWAPLYINAADYEVQPGISFLSQNKLGTAVTQLGYAYNVTDKTGKYKAAFEYSGLFPVIKTEISYGKGKSTYWLIRKSVDVAKTDTVLQKYSWNEMEWKLNMRVPLYFSREKYTRFLQPEIEYSYNRISHDNTTPDHFYKGYYHSLSYRLYFQNMIRKAELDIVPDWGQAFDLIFRHKPGGGTGIGSLKAAEAYLYFPGLYKNQAIRLYNGIQLKNTNETLSFSDVVRFPRGISHYQNKRLYSFAADYIMPLFYPDISFGKFFYLKRIRSSLFYDFSNIRSNIYQDNAVVGSYTGNLSSTGIELTGDGYFLRFLSAPVSIGTRAIYIPDYKEFRLEFLLSVNFGSF